MDTDVPAPDVPSPTAPAGTVPVFDGHNDTVLSLRATGRPFLARGDEGHIDLPRAREGGLVGGIFAVFVTDPGERPGGDPPGVITSSPELSLDYAQRFAMTELARLLRIEAESGGAVRIVRSAAELRACLADGTFAVQLHFEGAEAIDPDLDALEVFHAAGLRSLGPVWSRSNAFGHGVPFDHGHSPDTGPGLTDAGRELVRACNRLRVMLDLSHLNEAGFWDVAALTDAPLVASHSNAWAISPSTRNLTDKQLDAVRDSEGLVGVNFHVGFLRPDGERDPATPLSVMADHVDYLVDRLGIDKVGLGSDFDGATMPAELADATALPNLFDVLRGRGYDDAALAQIGHGNWLRVLGRTWGA
ncbi:MAG: Microsomal dipeptidase [uncultured Thermomicrobiales bacterium]|uniref:Microsomal dipeptidase n=1 Tax=uncultured Thermomicrobiales bacterium TaxID=1645740 RepID=A0A6J4VQT8_9BACT|nr:MAG: Microsomal dipeptidase [uncultured Thermomicrobiales bacterium]